MREEYDFSKGERGKFYRPGATLQTPVYLEEPVRSWFYEKATQKGMSVEDLVNEVLKKEIAVIDSTE
jgi:hypothetical protein